MPYSIRKLPNKDLYKVYNTETKAVHSAATTLENALKQVKLLHMVDAGVPLTKGSVAYKKQGGSLENPKLLELFKGTGSVGKQAKKMGFQVTSLDFDPIYTPDIETDILKWDYKKYCNDNNYIPDMIWSSPPCNTFSPMVYRLKEREVDTAKPISDRAKLGTKILYKTLEIIEYFLKKNPKLLFIIENPRGMMRKDKEMKKLARETTLYCIYGDFKRKPTDFWNNFPQGLGIDQESKSCPNKVIPITDLKTIEERYSMPSKLIKHFLDEFKDQYGMPKELNGGSIETDKFDKDKIVSLPEFRSVKIDLPTYMYSINPYVKGYAPQYKYKLVIPVTKARNISSRKSEKSLNISQKPISKPNVEILQSTEQPLLEDFSPEDKRKIEEYYANVKANEDKDINAIKKDAYAYKQRGKPLPCKKCDGEKKQKEPAEEPAKEPRKKGKELASPVNEIDEWWADILKDQEERKLKERSQEDTSSSVKSSKPSSVKPSSVKPSSVKPSSPASDISPVSSSLDSFDPDAELKKKLLGRGIKNNISTNNIMPNKWVEYVKDFASKNGISYRDALKHPECKSGYKVGGGVIDELGNQTLVAEAYRRHNLGANADKKYISL